MSSLRLALKQSLQEAGGGGKQKQSRSKRNDGRKKKRDQGGGGDSPRKRGRPQKGSRRDSDDEDDNDHQYGDSSSDENEFSAGEEDDDEEEDEDEDEDSDTQSHNDDDDQPHVKVASSRPSSSKPRGHEEHDEGEDEAPAHRHRARNTHDSDEEDDRHDSDKERRKQQRKLHKKIKNSAANKIQNQWKKKKVGNDNITEGDGPDLPPKASDVDDHPSSDATKKNGGEDRGGGQEQQGSANDQQKKKKKGKTAKTVPPPLPEILEWNRALPIKRARKNVKQGLRVKVRFATKVKREGKIVRKKRWFGGRVSAVSKEGSKIRIKYDDGTAEISKFPDKDVVVDDASNGEHQGDASKFQPPEFLQEDSVNEGVEDAGLLQNERQEDAELLQNERQEQKQNSLPQKEDNENDEQSGKIERDQQESQSEEQKAKPKHQLLADKEKLQNQQQREDEEKVLKQQEQLTQVHQSDSSSKPASNDRRSSSPVCPAALKDSISNHFDSSDRRAESPEMASAHSNKALSPPDPHGVPLLSGSTEPRGESPAPPAVSSILEQANNSEGTTDMDSRKPFQENDADMFKPEDEAFTDPKETVNAIAESSSTLAKSAEHQSAPSFSEDRLHKSTGEKHETTEGPEFPETTKPLKRTSTPIPQEAPVESIVEDIGALSPPVDLLTRNISNGGPSEGKGDDTAEVPPPPPLSKQISKPSLTIRIPNLTKERRISTPVKTSSQESSEEEEGGLSQQMLQPAPEKKPKVVPEQTTKQATPRLSISLSLDKNMKLALKEGKKGVNSKKRSLDGTEDEEEGEVAEPVEPPSKRIHLENRALSSEASTRADHSLTLKLKAKRPSSSESGDKSSFDKEVATTKDDADDGPVKIAGRASAKRTPLFSDEEDSAAPVTAPKVVNRTPTNEVDQPTPPLLVKKVEEESEPKRPKATKARASEPLSILEKEASLVFKDELLASSKNSAFEKQGSSKGIETKVAHAQVDNSEATSSTNQLPATEMRPSTPMDKASSTVVRSGRRAAQEANERIVTTKAVTEKEKVKEATHGTKKRKKSDEDSESSNEDDNNWVQCDKCKKWRIIPNNIKISSLPDRWYCHLNVYDPKRNNCDAPEQTARTPVIKKKKRGKKKRPRADPGDATLAEETKPASRRDSILSDVSKDKASRPRSPVPKDDIKPRESKSKEDKIKESKSKESGKSSGVSTPKPARASPISASVASTGGTLMPELGPEPKKKRPKSEKKSRRLPDAPLQPIPEVPPVDTTKVKRGRSAKKKESKEKDKDQDATSNSVHGSASSFPAEQDADNVEWVQCEKCDKWRKLPPHISADELPDVWYCSMNTWNPGSSTCDAPEDNAEGQQDINGSGGTTSHGSKLTYRNLIFGSKGKVNRPVSERTRAAESIFAMPLDDSESGYPQVMYANSSAFAPRGSRATIIEEENDGVSVFQLMQHSNLWTELRSLGSSSFASPFSAKRYYTFENLSSSMKEDLKRMILKTLENNKTLLGEEVARECQRCPWENVPQSWTELSTHCNKDLVITMLCELVTQGQVQLCQTFGKDWTVKDWNPRYRLHTPTNITNETAGKSRCMKIAKPWKQKL